MVSLITNCGQDLTLEADRNVAHSFSNSLQSKLIYYHF